MLWKIGDEYLRMLLVNLYEIWNNYRNTSRQEQVEHFCHAKSIFWVYLTNSHIFWNMLIDMIIKTTYYSKHVFLWSLNYSYLYIQLFTQIILYVLLDSLIKVPVQLKRNFRIIINWCCMLLRRILGFKLSGKN